MKKKIDDIITILCIIMIFAVFVMVYWLLVDYVKSCGGLWEALYYLWIIEEVI